MTGDHMPHAVRIRSIARAYARWVTAEAVGGLLLLSAAVIALLWANSPWATSYAALSNLQIGSEALGLRLSVAAWATDGLLSVFFFVVGVELKNELVAGSLRNPRQAVVPVFAAIGGMILPALLYTAVILCADDKGALNGWAIPTATDIAFALAILAIFGQGLPKALRTFLLTLAVVDDLLAIIVIAVFYTSTIHWLSLLAAIGMVVVFAICARMRRTHWWLLLPTAVVAWFFMHSSGVHATIAAVLLGLTVPAIKMHGEEESRAVVFERKVRPFSSGFALPVFAFFASGVTVMGPAAATNVIAQPVVLAIVIGLVLGKLGGVLGVTALLSKTTSLRLPDAIRLRDLLPIGFLAGIGFTVSLLVTELSFTDSTLASGAKIAVLLGTFTASILAAVVLRWDAKKARATGSNRHEISGQDSDGFD